MLPCSDFALKLITRVGQLQHRPPHHREPLPHSSLLAGLPLLSGGVHPTGCLLTLLHDALALGEEPAAAASLEALSAALAAELVSASAAAAGEALMTSSAEAPSPQSAASLMRSRHPEDWDRLPAGLRDSVVGMATAAAAAHQLSIREQRGAAAGSLVQQQHGPCISSRYEADQVGTVAALDILFSMYSAPVLPDQ